MVVAFVALNQAAPDLQTVSDMKHVLTDALT
jgi:hypothetical protein